MKIDASKIQSLGDFETVLVDGISNLSPWLAPIPSAVLVAKATVIHLGWSQIVGFISAAIIECLGITTVSTALLLWNYNRNRRKNDEEAPFVLAVTLVGTYFISTVGLTVVLDIVPKLAHYAPGIFPLLTLVGAVTIALRSDHKRRLNKIIEDKAERKEKRQGNAKQTSEVPSHEASNWVSNIANSDGVIDRLQMARQVKVDARIKKSFDIFRDNPGITITDAAKKVGVSRQTMTGYVNQLKSEGRLKRNGHGIEVI